MSKWGKRCTCLKTPDDEVNTLDYRHKDLDEIPSDVFTHERTLEELLIDSNRIHHLPRVSEFVGLEGFDKGRIES